MDTVPATLVTGLPGAGKAALLRQWLAAKPAGERWALLLNRPDAAGLRVRLPGGRADAGDGFAADAIETIGGCACCSGRLAFETALLRLLRRGPWSRLLIELDGSGDPARFVDLLRAGAARRHLRLDEVVAVTDAETARAWLEDAPAEACVRSGSGSGSGGLRDRLLAAQLESADRVVLTGCGALADPQACKALAASLRVRPPFRRRVEIAQDPETPSSPPGIAPDSPEAWPLLASPESAQTECALAHLPAGGLRRLGIAHPDAPAWATWRWPPETGFDRADLERLIADCRVWPGLLQAEGAFRTERDWYAWRRDGTGDAWSPTGWRRDNRLALRLAAGPGSFERLVAAVEAGLVGAIRMGPPG